MVAELAIIKLQLTAQLLTQVYRFADSTMFTLREEQLDHELAGDGGEACRRFVNSLITATAGIAGIKSSQYSLQSKGNLSDGGVDGQVDVAIVNDRSGWFEHSTVWQLKSTNARPTQGSIAEEIAKPYMAELLQKGYALRWVSRCHMSPSDIAKTEREMNALITGIHRQARPARLLTLKRLSEWAALFPAITLQYLNIETILSMDAWSRSACGMTRSFILPKSWESIRDRLVAHVDLSKQVDRSLLVVRGPAGVGKSRLCFECCRQLSGADATVVYAMDGERAIEVAIKVLRHASSTLVIVADDCDERTQYRLDELCDAERNRCRVVAIDNGSRSSSAEVFLPPMGEGELASVIQANFPECASERAHQHRSHDRRLCSFCCILVQGMGDPGYARSVRSYARTHYW